MNAFAGIRPKGGRNPTPLAFFPGVCSGGYLFSSGGPTPTTPPPIFTLADSIRQSNGVWTLWRRSVAALLWWDRLWLVSLEADGQNQFELRRTSLLSATWSAVKRTSKVQAKVPVRLPKRSEWATDPSRKWISSCQQLFGACQRRFSAMPLNLNGWNDAEFFWDVWPLIRWNRCSLPTKRISIWTLL